MNGAQLDTPLLSVCIGDVADAHVEALSPFLEFSLSYLVYQTVRIQPLL